MAIGRVLGKGAFMFDPSSIIEIKGK